MAFQIFQISSTPPFNTFDSQFACNVPKNKSNIIWASGSNSFDEAATGSTRCVTLRLSKNADPVTAATRGGVWSPLPIQISGSSALLPSWYKSPDQEPPAKFKIAARLDGRDWLLESDEIQILTPTPVIQVPTIKLLQDVRGGIPFRMAGDMTWMIQRTEVKTEPVYFDTKTRLELIFVFAALAPCGPWDTPESGPEPSAPTRPDFKDKYYIDLFRLFLPSQWELLDALPSAPSTVTNTITPHPAFLSWYLARIIRTIWNLGLPNSPHPEYPFRPATSLNPLANAQSFYLSPAYPELRTSGSSAGFDARFGGVFELRRFMRGAYAYATVADLAALTQLACALVRDADGNEALDSRWILSEGNAALGRAGVWGAVNPGTMFGWPQFPQCNSPVLAAGGAPVEEGPETGRRRALLGWHVWVEVVLGEEGDRRVRVLDVSQAFGEPGKLMFMDGRMNRREYLNIKIDAAWPSPLKLPPRTPARQNWEGVVFYSSPETMRNRIGVMGVAESNL